MSPLARIGSSALTRYRVRKSSSRIVLIRLRRSCTDPKQRVAVVAHQVKCLRSSCSLIDHVVERNADQRDGERGPGR